MDYELDSSQPHRTGRLQPRLRNNRADPGVFVLKPRLEGKVLVMQEQLSFGIGLPSYEFQDSHGNITYRSMFMPGRNEIRHDALVAVSSLPDSREVLGQILPVGQLPSSCCATRCRAVIAIRTS